MPGWGLADSACHILVFQDPVLIKNKVALRSTCSDFLVCQGVFFRFLRRYGAICLSLAENARGAAIEKKHPACSR